MLEDLAQAGCGVLLIKCLAGDQEVFLRPVAFCLRQLDRFALSCDVYPVRQPLFDLLRSSWSSLEGVVFISELTAASRVCWAKELLESDQSVIGCLVILDQVDVAYSNRLADICVQVGQCLHLGAVLGAAALPSIAFPSVGFSIVCCQVREPRSSSLVVDKLRLGRLRQLREKLLRYIRVDVLPETVAVGNVSANEQPEDLPVGQPYTLYWVWQWVNAPNVDTNLPNGKDEYYTSCIDVDIDGASDLALLQTDNKLMQQDRMDTAVLDFKSRGALTTNPLAISSQAGFGQSTITSDRTFTIAKATLGTI
jgi:hypothetical protein